LIENPISTATKRGPETSLVQSVRLPLNWMSKLAFFLIAMLLAGCGVKASPNQVEIVKSATNVPAREMSTPPRITSTLQPTPKEPVSPTLTPTRTATTIPIRKISLPHDLLFLSDGKLMRWSHTQSEPRPAIIDVLDYSASVDGSKIAVVRKTGITANGVETFDLTILDTWSGNFVTLLGSTERLAAFRISPDGDWLALMNGLQQIYLLPTDGSDDGELISECQSDSAGDCNDLSWSPDSLEVIWDDARGIWQAGPDELLPRLVISNQLNIPDPKGQMISKQVQFHGLSWSPFGRYVLTRIQPNGSDVSWQAVVDTSLGRMAEIPTSYRLDQPNALAFWLKNGNLAVVHRDDKQTNRPVTLESWQILPTRPDLMRLEFRWEFDDKQLEAFKVGQHTDGLPMTPCQLNDRTLSLAWNSSQLDGPGGLFTFDIKYGILEKIAEIPAHIVKATWTPEGNAALVQGSDGTLRFVSIDGSTISDLTNRIGQQTCCFTWLADETGLN
jgi:hypothetical protein